MPSQFRLRFVKTCKLQRPSTTIEQGLPDISFLYLKTLVSGLKRDNPYTTAITVAVPVFFRRCRLEILLSIFSMCQCVI